MIRWPWIETSKFVKQEQCSYKDFISSVSRNFSQAFNIWKSVKDKSWNRRLRIEKWPWLKGQKLNCQTRTDYKSIKIILYVQPCMRIRLWKRPFRLISTLLNRYVLINSFSFYWCQLFIDLTPIKPNYIASGVFIHNY